MIMSLSCLFVPINFFSPDIGRPDFKEQSIQALVLEPFKVFFKGSCLCFARNNFPL